MREERIRRAARVLAATALAVAVTSAGVAFLESLVGVPDASSLYVVAVTAIAIGFGIPGAILTAIASVLAYDLLFVSPLHTLTVSDPGEWLNLILLLFVAVTVGQLAALQRRRAEAAVERERESRALFDLTRALAIGESTAAALPAICSALARDAAMDVVWITFGADDAAEAIAARSSESPIPWPPRSVAVLHRPGQAARSAWTLLRPPGARGAGTTAVRHFRVRIEDGGRPIGSIWAVRPHAAPEPGEAPTRLLQVAADLIAQALAHERLIDEQRRAEVAQQSDQLKTALLESVSHDLRTPLATIRALAGMLIDPVINLEARETRATATKIDGEAERLNRLVGNLLDLSRIEGGALHVADETLDLDDVVRRAAGPLADPFARHMVEIDVPAQTFVRADPVLLEQAFVNLFDNAHRHAGAEAVVRVVARLTADDRVRITVEDSGPGVVASALPRLFDRFYRAGTAQGRGSGTGIGLAVVRGFVEAMGGDIRARPSELGGLAIDLDIEAAAVPAHDLASSVESVP